jgi:hypothetical protein
MHRTEDMGIVHDYKPDDLILYEFIPAMNSSRRKDDSRLPGSDENTFGIFILSACVPIEIICFLFAIWCG